VDRPKEKFKEIIFLVLTLGKGAMKQIEATSRNWGRQESRLLLKALEGIQPHQDLDFSK
jgi:hypothetical protein